MAILMEVIHELRHTSEETFAEYVQVYGETTVVALEAAGEEVLGGWRWLTGDHTRDLLLIRADSMADMEAKEASFGESMESVLESLMPFIGNMEERTGYRIPLPMANEERLDAARAAGARGVCPYIITRGFVGSLEVAEEYIGLLSTLADEVEGHGRSLVTAYANSTGPRSCFTTIWRLDDGFDALAWPRGVAVETRKRLSEIVRSETLDLLEPLPYSKLR